MFQRTAPVCSFIKAVSEPARMTKEYSGISGLLKKKGNDIKEFKACHQIDDDLRNLKLVVNLTTTLNLNLANA